jgi:AcrR family transcriptional regulator
VIAHPGHELRVHHWLETAAPMVFVLTDGSGHAGVSRLASTTRLLARAGATPGSIYGRFSDRELYRALLDKDWDRFAVLADELAAALDAAGIEDVAGDAVEGFNPSHDVCRLLLNTALLRLAATTGRRPGNFEIPLESSPEECPAADLEESIRLRLDDAALERKLRAAAGYPEMAAEVERAFARHGRAPFAVECLRPVRYDLEIGGRFAHPPYYETYGERQVAAGHYRDVIRFREHLAPLAAALGEWTPPQTPPAPDEARLPCESC